jgi:hypothetical protein
MIIHIPLYKRKAMLGKSRATPPPHCNGWLYLRFEAVVYDSSRCGGRDELERPRLYHKGWHLDLVVGLSMGKTTYSVIHDEY